LTTNQNKCLLRRHDERDAGQLPRALVKVEGDEPIGDHNLPAAGDGGAEGCVY